MQKEKRIIPNITSGEYVAKECSVCSIDDIIGTDSDFCSIHYSDPNVSYKYAYDYNIVLFEKSIMAYYIGVDRFFEVGSTYQKEYVLYEYAVFEEDFEVESESNELLFSHLKKLAEVTGCSRIILNKNGGNDEFYSYFEKAGFVTDGDNIVFNFDSFSLSDYDSFVIPTSNDKLTFFDLFTLREGGFDVGKDVCRYDASAQSIVIDKKSGVCSFSDIFKLSPNREFILSDMHTLNIIHACRELLRMGVKESINIIFPDEKESETTPDILVGTWGIFIFSDSDLVGMKEKMEISKKLKSEGKLNRFSPYTYSFDKEAGGDYMNLYYVEIK